MIQQQHQLYLMAAMLFIYIMVFFLWIRPQQTVESKQKNFIIAFFAFFALLPNLLITDTEHFLFALPIIFISLTHLFNTKNKILAACFVACILMYGANSSDLLGNTLSNHFEEWGLLGIGNLGLIGLFIYSQIKTKTLNI